MHGKAWLAVGMSALLVGVFTPAITAVSAQSTTTTTLNLFDDGDTNLEQLWDALIPQYEKLHPNIKINLIWNQHGTDDSAIYARLAASVAAGKPAPFDITDSGINTEGEYAHLFVRVGTAGIPNIKLVAPELIKENLYQGVPYRGSEVVLAYNSATVKNPPKSLGQLLTWIQQNPGKFDYCNPEDGGSGDYFAMAVVLDGLKASQIAAFQNPTSYHESLESAWTPGMNRLAALGKDMYRSGFYPGGNTQILQLLAQGAIQMATVWSDQGTSALQTGQLPKTIKLVQLKDPFYGSPVSISIPKNSQHIKAAEAFVNWVLAPAQQVTIMKAIAGFPGIEWKYLPAADQAEFKSVEAPYVAPMASKYSSDMTAMWQKVVAGASANG